jgi:DNA-binding NtrC family response regulator
MPNRVLVVDVHPSFADHVAALLATYDVTRETDGARALALLAGAEPFDVVVTDVRVPGADGFELLRAAKRASPATEVVLMTAFATVPDAVQAVKQGAYDYLEKPFDPDDVALAVARALGHRRAVADEPPCHGTGAAADEVSAAPGARVSLPFREAVEAARDRASRGYLVALMREFGGCVTRAARRAGMERESLHRVLRRYGIQSDAFKPPAPPRPGGEEAGALAAPRRRRGGPWDALPKADPRRLDAERGEGRAEPQDRPPGDGEREGVAALGREGLLDEQAG